MKMTNEKVAKKVVPKAVKLLFAEEVSRKERKMLISVLSENVVRYGYEDRRIITEENVSAFSWFSAKADRFFTVLNKSIQIAERLERRCNSHIISFVISSDKTNINDMVLDLLDLELWAHREAVKERKEMMHNMPGRCVKNNISLFEDDDYYF